MLTVVSGNGNVVDYNDTGNDYGVAGAFRYKVTVIHQQQQQLLLKNAISTAVYDANATDNGGAVDAGITYTISGTDASTFNINSAGQVKFNTSIRF